jgi:ferredoxin
MTAFIDKELCTGCGDCVEICPTSAIQIINDKAQVDTDGCSECGICADECPVGAISLA